MRALTKALAEIPMSSWRRNGHQIEKHWRMLPKRRLIEVA